MLQGRLGRDLAQVGEGVIGFDVGLLSVEYWLFFFFFFFWNLSLV